jgi:hypothetical protein
MVAGVRRSDEPDIVHSHQRRIMGEPCPRQHIQFAQHYPNQKKPRHNPPPEVQLN